ncbi:hypothetical protein D3C85_1174270 [compost metagenome]
MVVGQVHRIARRIGRNPPAQFRQRHVIAIVHRQFQRSVGRAVPGRIADAQLQALQLLEFAVVHPDDPGRDDAQPHGGGHGYGQSLGRVAQQQDQPGDDQQDADEHDAQTSGAEKCILPKRRCDWRWERFSR